MVKLPKKLEQKLRDRAANTTLRSLSRPNTLVDFSSNDYLGFSRNKKLFERTTALLTEKGIFENGATGSRLLSGNHQLYEELELKIADFHKAELALVFNSGYDANCGFFGSVPQRGDIVFYDEFIHASIRDGIRLGNAKSYKFKHNNLNDLKRRIAGAVLSLSKGSRNAIQDHEHIEIYIATESVFSMDGDSPDLKAFADFSEENNYHLIVDEAHGLGVFGTNGSGLVQQHGLERKVFARIITFGKALGGHGAAILGSTGLIQYLVNFARSFIYTTGLPPHSVAAILAVYSTLSKEDSQEERQRLKKNSVYFKNQILSFDLQDFFIPSESAIHCCIIPENDRVNALADKMQKSGYDVRAICAPTVPKNQERLRFCLHSYNTAAEISSALFRLSELIQS